jgi:hypothetical protein
VCPINGDGDILYVYAKDEETAAEMQDKFALHISIIATDILKREVAIVLVLPKQLIQQVPFAGRGIGLWRVFSKAVCRAPTRKIRQQREG